MRCAVMLLALSQLAFISSSFTKGSRKSLPVPLRCHDIHLLLFAFQADDKTPGDVVIPWEAVVVTRMGDPDVKIRSVSLEWSVAGDGAWHSIGPTRLPNLGRYGWRVPKDIPDSVYFRLSAFDSAGRMNYCQTKTSYPYKKDISGTP